MAAPRAGAALLAVLIALTAAASTAGSPHALRGGGLEALHDEGPLARPEAPPAAPARADPSSDGPGPGARLVHVQVVFRHGARTPITTAYYNETLWACDEAYEGTALDIANSAGGPAPPLVDADAPQLPGGCRQGTLTRRGYQMALDLGAALRKRYVTDAPLLPPSYAPGAVFAHTTNYRRTVATLKGVLTALYPGAAGPAAWPVNATAEPDTYFYPSTRACPALAPELEDLTRGADEREAAAPKEDAERVIAALGLPPAAGGAGAVPLAWQRLRDVIACMLAEWPEKRPAGLTDELWELIQKRATDYELSIYAPGPWNCPGPAAECRDVLRYSVGPLLWRLLRNAEAAAAAAGAAAGAPPASSCAPASNSAPHAAAGPAPVLAADPQEQPHAHQPHSQHPPQQQQQPEQQQPQQPPAGPLLALFSAHDTTVAPILSALGVHPGAWPPFTANIALELWLPAPGASGGAARAGQPWVRAVYGGAPLPLGGGGRRAAAAGGGEEALGGPWRWEGVRLGRGGGQAGPAHAAAPHWRRAQQEQPAGAGETAGARDTAQPGAAEGGGGAGAGWISLDDLRARLEGIAISDAEKRDACWRGSSGGGRARGGAGSDSAAAAALGSGPNAGGVSGGGGSSGGVSASASASEKVAEL